VIQASQAASGNYAAATATTSFVVAPEVPTISFGAIANQTLGASPVALSINSPSNGAVTYSVTSGSATVSGSTLTITGAGTVSVTATQAASGNYAAATATTSFSVTAGAVAISFAPIPAKSFGSAPFALSINSPSNGAVTYTVTNGPATLSGSTLTITGLGTVSVRATQAATASYQAATTETSFVVTPGQPVLSINSIPAVSLGAQACLHTSSTSNGLVTYSVVSGPGSLSGTCIRTTGLGTVVVQATQAASGKYASTTANTSFNVVPATPALTFSPVATQTFGTAPFAVSANSVSQGAITYSVVSGSATVTGNLVKVTGFGLVRLQAVQAASGNYGAATTTTTFFVNRAEPTLTFAPIAQQTFSNHPIAVSATSASTGYVSYAVQSGPATIVGGKVVVSGTGTVVLTATQLEQGNYLAATATTSFEVVGTTLASNNIRLAK
jgi:hypothetical protein